MSCYINICKLCYGDLEQVLANILSALRVVAGARWEVLPKRLTDPRRGTSSKC